MSKSYSAAPSYDAFANLRIKDEYLLRVLKGEAFLVQDGAMGTLLQQRGLTDHGEVPDLLNFSHPQEITDIHAGYVCAGAQMITTNTFGANAYKLEGRAEVSEVYRAAAKNAREAGARYVAGDIGPIGALLEPLGTFSFDDAYALFAEQVRAASDASCDLIVIETMTDLREAKAAVLAAKECADLPVFVSMTFGEDGRTFLGTSPRVAAATLSALGVHVMGVNCSLGPDELVPVVQELLQFSRCPVLVKPNAGLPCIQEGLTVFNVEPGAFAATMERMITAGVSVIGGCCGTTPAFTAELTALVEGRTPAARPYCPALVVSSAQEAVVLEARSSDVFVIGERINPTGKPRMKAALVAGDFDYLVGEAVSQQEAGAAILDVNVGLPELDEPQVLRQAVEKLQATVTLPLQIDSSDPVAIEAAVRGYAGKALVNSVNGKKESMNAVFPLVKHYGCGVVGLTLDEEGIPTTAEGRLAIARRLVQEAEGYGIPRCDVVIDCLVMAAATNQDEISEILRAVTLVKQQLGVRTVLGVSNVSFGMPQRGLLNATFLAAALGAGLDLPILNPLAPRYREVIESFKVLNGQDKKASSFITRFASMPNSKTIQKTDAADVSQRDTEQQATFSAYTESSENPDSLVIPASLLEATAEVRAIEHFILAGRKASMATAVKSLLKKYDPLVLIDGVFIPALDAVGAKFERGNFFLPQLMASAEAVKSGFDVVRTYVGEAASIDNRKAVIVATVKGDIHDIGKNIVKMLLENYGYRVIDLGRDVQPEQVLNAVREQGVCLVGLSALMTTTVKAMEQTITLLHQEVPDVTVFVGGAVLTPEYAQMIGADYYGKDAAEAARIVERFFARQV